jgi:hypothetical protein
LSEWEHTANGGWTKFTPENRETIIAIVAMGNFVETACHAVGISSATYVIWKRRGKNDLALGNETEYANFYLSILAIEARVQQQFLGYWTKAAEKNWEAARAFLALRFPGLFGRDMYKSQQADQPASGVGNTPSVPDLVSQILAQLSTASDEERQSMLNAIESFMSASQALEDIIGGLQP